MQFLPIAEKKQETETTSWAEGEVVELADLETEDVSGEVCCGGPPPPKSNPFERPGYQLQPYVRAFKRYKKYDVALVKTELESTDCTGTLLARLGIIRDNYKVAPGLYGAGSPGPESPVLVTANYKLSFDVLRRELDGIDCWILVLDTCGINVWCAAGKQTFSTAELLERLEECDLAGKVNHRRLVVPQLGATGIAAHTVKLKSGFRVVYGPVRAEDIGEFLKNEMRTTADMRAVTFTLWERFELIPVEFYLFGKKIWWIFPLLFLLSGIGPEFFSLEQAWRRGLLSSLCVIAGGISGAMFTPLLLPWLPSRSFSLKGTWLGLPLALLFAAGAAESTLAEKAAVVLVFTAVSSYLAMNFTGSTPYTSPSGVEKEMKRAIPCQGLAVLAGALLWSISPFLWFPG